MKIGPRLGLYSAGYQLSRRFSYPRLLPVNLTVSVTYQCNSRCKTCNVWKIKSKDELKVEEYQKIFDSLKTVPVWFTMSGGEPFLRKDLPEICGVADSCKPAVINIPTNGLLPKRIEESVREILDITNSKLVLNLSLDGIGKTHDEIRGVPGNFDKAMETFDRLEAIRIEDQRLILGIHSVISKLSLGGIDDLLDLVDEIKPDSYIVEVAEERNELETVGFGLTPTPKEYSEAIETIKSFGNAKGFGKRIQRLRHTYYDIVKEVLIQKRQIIPCYAGWASGQIDPHGNVWACCIRAASMGSLRENDYNFRKVWYSKEAE